MIAIRKLPAVLQHVIAAVALTAFAALPALAQEAGPSPFDFYYNVYPEWKVQTFGTPSAAGTNVGNMGTLRNDRTVLVSNANPKTDTEDHEWSNSYIGFRGTFVQGPLSFGYDVQGLTDFQGSFQKNFRTRDAFVFVEHRNVGRFMLGHGTDGPDGWFIDCYDGGVFRTRAEVKLILLQNGLPATDDPTQSVGTPHPVVCAHPVTGRPMLYLGRRRNAYVIGLPLAESEALLDELWRHAARPEHCLAHRWRVGDLLLWDNRNTMHRRDSFDPASRRVMHRTQIKGSAVPREYRVGAEASAAA